MKWVNQIAESIPDHSKSIAELLKFCMNSELLDDDTKNSIAYVSALSSGNAELAFEIEMSCLTKSPLRETLKGIVSEMSFKNKFEDFMSIYDIQIGMYTSKNTDGNSVYNDYLNYTCKSSNYVYCFAISVAQSCKSNSKHYYLELSKLLWDPEKINLVSMLSSTISSINKITL